MPFPAGRRERESRGAAIPRGAPMTRQKSFKRLVRNRMEKTGESYTAARAMLLAGDEPRPTTGRGLRPPTRRSAAAPAAAGRSGSTRSTSGGPPSGRTLRSRAGSRRSSTSSRSPGSPGDHRQLRADSRPARARRARRRRSRRPRRRPSRRPSSGSTTRSSTPPSASGGCRTEGCASARRRGRGRPGLTGTRRDTHPRRLRGPRRRQEPARPRARPATRRRGDRADEGLLARGAG